VSGDRKMASRWREDQKITPNRFTASPDRVGGEFTLGKKAKITRTGSGRSQAVATGIFLEEAGWGGLFGSVNHNTLTASGITESEDYAVPTDWPDRVRMKRCGGVGREGRKDYAGKTQLARVEKSKTTRVQAWARKKKQSRRGEENLNFLIRPPEAPDFGALRTCLPFRLCPKRKRGEENQRSLE